MAVALKERKNVPEYINHVNDKTSLLFLNTMVIASRKECLPFKSGYITNNIISQHTMNTSLALRMEECN